MEKFSTKNRRIATHLPAGGASQKRGNPWGNERTEKEKTENQQKEFHIISNHWEGSIWLSTALQVDKNGKDRGNKVFKEERNDKKKPANPSARWKKYLGWRVLVDCQTALLFPGFNLSLLGHGISPRRRPHDFAHQQQRHLRIRGKVLCCWNSIFLSI